MSVVVAECGDFSEFQEALKKMRRLDDLIVQTLNAALPTDSFHPNGTQACKDLHKQIQEGNQNRSRVIKNCINVTADKVRKLREKRDSESADARIQKDLRQEQTKLKMLRVELTVEDLVQERTNKVFLEKCRSYFKPT